MRVDNQSKLKSEKTRVYTLYPETSTKMPFKNSISVHVYWYWPGPSPRPGRRDGSWVPRPRPRYTPAACPRLSTQIQSCLRSFPDIWRLQLDNGYKYAIRWGDKKLLWTSCGSGSAYSFGKSDPDSHHKPDPDPRQSQSSEAVEVNKGAMEAHHGVTVSMLRRRPGSSQWSHRCRVCRPVVATLHHFDEYPAQDPHQSEKSDPNPHQSEKSDPDPHQSEKSDPDSHKREKLDPDMHQSGTRVGNGISFRKNSAE